MLVLGQLQPVVVDKAHHMFANSQAVDKEGYFQQIPTPLAVAKTVNPNQGINNS
jgi:hypothetical protein